MKKGKFRVALSRILAVILVLGSVSMPLGTTFAETDYTAYADALNQLGVFEGTDQGYELDRAPTRLEGLILFIKLLGEQGDIYSIKTFTNAFDDVPGWGSAFAEYAHAMGYTSGIGNRMFGSDQEMQAKSYITYLLKALGYETEIGDFSWATAIDDAVKLKVITQADANMLSQEAFTRGHVAYLSYKTLQATPKYSTQSLYDMLKFDGRLIGSLPQVHVDETQVIETTEVSTATSSSYDEADSKKREQEIIAAYDAIEIPVSSASYYMEKPNTEQPYKAGKLNKEMIRSALDMIDMVRMVAYLSTGITDDDEWNELAQHASLANYVNNQMSHYPEMPAGMSDEMYDKAVTGASTSNLYYGMYYAGSQELRNTVLGYMDDSDAYNIKALGHRRWMLHPNMEKVGVGYVTDGVLTYSAIRVFDDGDNSYFNTNDSADYVAWPSKSAFPTNFFSSSMAWSVSLNHSIYDNSKTSQIEVILTNESTGMSSVFKQDELMLVTEGTQKYFNIDTNGYGVPFTIIFRPDNYELKAGDVYSVRITGLYKKDGKRTELEYATRFFDM